jgi:hypothetical protein
MNRLFNIFKSSLPILAGVFLFVFALNSLTSAVLPGHKASRADLMNSEPQIDDIPYSYGISENKILENGNITELGGFRITMH